MHILVFPSWYPKNPQDIKGVFFRDQAQALSAYGHTVGVVAPQMHSIRKLSLKKEGTELLTYELDNDVPTYRTKVLAAFPRIPYGNYLLFKLAATRLLERYVREYGYPDLIHAHSTLFAGAVASDWGKKNNIPVIVTEHSTGFARNHYRPWQLRLANKAIQGAKACIVVSPSLGEILEEQLPTIKGQWEWIPNVVAERFNAPTAKKSKVGPICFLNLALMTEKKGQYDLLKAFSKLVKDGSTAELWLVGDGPIRMPLKKLAERLDITHQVRFLGQLAPDEIPSLLKQIDAVVVSSHYETFGVVAAEALISGVPVIATQCGGPEWIVTEKDGLLVPPRDPRALSTAMKYITENLTEYDPQDIAARANRRFSSTAIARQLTEFYTFHLATKTDGS